MGPHGRETRVTGDRRPEGRPGRLGHVRMVTEPGSGRVQDGHRIWFWSGQDADRIRFGSGPGILYAHAALMDQLTVNGFGRRFGETYKTSRARSPPATPLDPARGQA